MKLSKSDMISKSENRPRVLAIIPARGGSKGLPRKNIMDLCGKPLIAYSIEVAVNAASIDRVIVSTEDEEIASIAESYGAEVPFLRPKEFAQDHSSIGDAIQWTIQMLNDQGDYPDILVTLYPTHPFRSVRLVECLIEKLQQGFDRVDTVKSIDLGNTRLFTQNHRQRLIPLTDQNVKIGNGTIKKYFRPYGLFHGMQLGGKTDRYLHVIDNPVSLIDIDTFVDFQMAEAVVKNNWYDFETGHHPSVPDPKTIQREWLQ